MATKARIASIAFGDARKGKTQEEMAHYCLDYVDQLSKCHTDLICLPEEILIAGGQKQNSRWELLNEQILHELCLRAKQMHTLIACCIEEPSLNYPGKRYNTAYLIDRNGDILGKYRKRYLTYRALENDGLPGKNLPIFDTDIGRIGLQICFDIGWRMSWLDLGNMGCDLVVWNSAYDGGTLLNTYAAHNLYFIASSVWTDHAKIINPMGQTVEESSRWDGFAVADVHLDTEVFHIDRQEKCIPEIRRFLGDKVIIHSYSQENVFTLSSNDPDWPMSRIADMFSLVSYRNYHEEYGLLNDKQRSLFP